MNTYSSSASALGRALLALIFVISGLGKIAAPAGTVAYIEMTGLPLPWLAYLGAVVIEVGGGLLLAVGYQTRLVAGVTAGFTIATALAFHFNFGDQNQAVHFLKNIAIAGGLLQVVAFGSGRYSVDAWLGCPASGRISIEDPQRA